MDVRQVTIRGTWSVEVPSSERYLVVEVAPPLGTYVCSCGSLNCPHIQSVLETFTQPESFDDQPS